MKKETKQPCLATGMCIAVSNNMKVHSKQTEHNENSKKNLEAEKQSFN